MQFGTTLEEIYDKAGVPDGLPKLDFDKDCLKQLCHRFNVMYTNDYSLYILAYTAGLTLYQGSIY